MFADGNKVHTLSSITYYFIVLREIVRIVLMLAPLNGLGVNFADVQNSYINAKPK